MYLSVWKCRLCGQRYCGEMKFTAKEVSTVLDVEDIREMVSFHNCYGGDIGIADFMGWEKDGQGKD